MARAFLAAGSNLGERRAHLRRALRALEDADVRVRRASSVWETEPLDGAGPGWFLNMVVEVEFGGTPLDLLERLQRIERQAGRVRAAPNAPRELDLDVLWLSTGPVDEPRPTVPHPRMWERAFVLAPLEELAPDLRHPEDGRTVRECAAGARGRIRRLGPLGDLAPDPATPS